MKKLWNNTGSAIWRCLNRLVSLDWFPDSPYVKIRDINHDDVLVQAAYRAVSIGSTANWVEREVALCAEQCRTKTGKEACLSFLQGYKAWKQQYETYKELMEL